MKGGSYGPLLISILDFDLPLIFVHIGSKLASLGILVANKEIKVNYPMIGE